jgi:hypothetical protein
LPELADSYDRIIINYVPRAPLENRRMPAMSHRDRGFLVRLAVGDARGACSSVWRFWQGRNTDDLYIAPRNIAGCIKISLHDTGWFSLALTKQFYGQLRDAGDVPESVTNRTIAQWQRGIEPQHGCTEVLNILFPSEFLATQFTSVEKDTCLISPPENGKAVIIFCFISSPSAQIALAPDQIEIGRCVLSTGEKFIIISGIFTNFDAKSFWHTYRAHLHEVERIAILPDAPVTDVNQLGAAICIPLKEDNVLRLVVIGPEFVMLPEDFP